VTVNGEIRPFRIDVPQADLDDLRERLSHVRWPDELPGVGWRYGVPRSYLMELTEYWRTSYDWRACEARLNDFPQYTTIVDGTSVHFLHVRSPEPDALPVVISHGWPSSIVEFVDVIGPLTDPRGYGGDPADAFHVVVPSLPGFGFSGPTRETGWDPPRIARAFATLMGRLGYDRYGAHGTDWGARISRELGLAGGDRVVGVHITMMSAAAPPADLDVTGLPDLTGPERERIEASRQRSARFQAEDSGYSTIQATRPQTVAYGLADSPVGQLAWIVEKFKEWADAKDVPEDAVDRDQLLTNVMLYWLTGTAGSSARIFYESAKSSSSGGRVSETPVGMAVFPHDTVLAVRRFAERNANIVYWSEFDRGGHFAAMEEPDLMVADLRDFFRRFR
jgi:pimeloyl-ACP methyl ester carboxylesterase